MTSKHDKRPHRKVWFFASISKNWYEIAALYVVYGICRFAVAWYTRLGRDLFELHFAASWLHFAAFFIELLNMPQLCDIMKEIKLLRCVSCTRNINGKTTNIIILIM